MIYFAIEVDILKIFWEYSEMNIPSLILVSLIQINDNGIASQHMNIKIIALSIDEAAKNKLFWELIKTLIPVI